MSSSNKRGSFLEDFENSKNLESLKSSERTQSDKRSTVEDVDYPPWLLSAKAMDIGLNT